jgi:hypothetical protein
MRSEPLRRRGPSAAEPSAAQAIIATQITEPAQLDIMRIALIAVTGQQQDRAGMSRVAVSPFVLDPESERT